MFAGRAASEAGQIPSDPPERPPVILTVTLNPALDLTYTVDALIPYGTHRVTSVTERAGGKGLNVARVLHAIGEPVIATGLLGGATGSRVAALLRDDGPRSSFVPIAGETRRTVAVADGADATGFWEPGPRVTESEWIAFQAHFQDLLADVDVVALSGSLPPGLPVDAYATLVRLAAARGVRTVLDTSGEPLRHGLAAGPDLVKPNAGELAALLAAAGDRDADANAADGPAGGDGPAAATRNGLGGVSGGEFAGVVAVDGLAGAGTGDGPAAAARNGLADPAGGDRLADAPDADGPAAGDGPATAAARSALGGASGGGFAAAAGGLAGAAGAGDGRAFAVARDGLAGAVAGERFAGADVAAADDLTGVGIGDSRAIAAARNGSADASAGDGLADAAGAAGRDLADAALARAFGARSVVVSHGARGLLALTRDGAWRCVPPERLAGNPTGAGDACVAALARGLRDGTTWPALLADAVALSAAAVASPAAGEIDLDIYRRMLPGVTVTRVPPAAGEVGPDTLRRTLTATPVHREETDAHTDR